MDVDEIMTSPMITIMKTPTMATKMMVVMILTMILQSTTDS